MFFHIYARQATMVALEMSRGSRYAEEFRLSTLSLSRSFEGKDPWILAWNTAISAGSDVVRLGIHIDASCEVHGSFDPEHRQWAADLIRKGMREGFYRSEKWADVADLLESTKSRVVMSYSVCNDYDFSAQEPLLGIKICPETLGHLYEDEQTAWNFSRGSI